MESKALGKGLSALIPGKTAQREDKDVSLVPVDRIENSRFQPRLNYNDDKLKELKASIREKGVLQPILIRPAQNGYEVIAGERRLRAAKELNLGDIPAVIRDVSDEEALVLALIENIQREELNPMEEAEAFGRLIHEFKFTHESVADSVGKDRSTISNFIRLLKLPESIQKGLAEDRISMGHARALLSVDETGEQKRLYDKTVKSGLSVRELENLVKKGSAPKTRKNPADDERHPQIVDVENGLQKLLGTKVRIEQKKKRGSITIDFYSLDDLKRIVKLIIK